METLLLIYEPFELQKLGGTDSSCDHYNSGCATLTFYWVSFAIR